MPWFVLIPLDLLVFGMIAKGFFGDLAGFLDCLLPDDFGLGYDQYRVLLFLIIVGIVVYGELRAFGGL